MPFESEAQRRYMWAKHPKIARKWANEEKKASLDVKRGLIKNTVQVDGQEYKVNDGYLKPAFFGFGTAALSHSAINYFNNVPVKKALLSNIMAGLVGATAGMALTEVKRRSIENVLKSDPASARLVAKRGFNVKARTTVPPPKMISEVPDVVRAYYNASGLNSLAEEGMKVSSLNELKMIRDLDSVEDNANKAHFAYEGAALAATLADVSKPKEIKKIFEEIKDTKATVTFISPKDLHSAVGTRKYSLEEFQKKFPNSSGMLSDKAKLNAKTNGVVAIAPSNINKASILREIKRGKPNVLTSIPNSKIVRGLGKANIVYSIASKGNDTLADATAGAQFALYTPRLIEDMSATIGAGKIDKKTLIRNLAFAATRSLPGILPSIGRAFRHYQDKKSNS